MISYQLSHLEQLEAESIHIMREVAAECENSGDAILDRKRLLGHGAPSSEGICPG